MTIHSCNCGILLLSKLTAVRAGIEVTRGSDFDIFRHADSIRYTDGAHGGEIWRGYAKFYPDRCRDRAREPKKLKIL